ncbi:MAG: HPr family phosphocarrier protein [Pseudomonadota bacterium]
MSLPEAKPTSAQHSQDDDPSTVGNDTPRGRGTVGAQTDSAQSEGTQTSESHLILTMVNRRGLHARAAAKFVKTVEQFTSEVTVTKDGQSVNGRSIMGLLMLAATLGSAIDVRVVGQDAAAAADAIADLVNAGFGEVD